MIQRDINLSGGELRREMKSPLRAGASGLNSGFRAGASVALRHTKGAGLRYRALLTALVGWAALGCSGERGASKAPRPALTDSLVEIKQAEHQARWFYHPVRSAQPLASFSLGSGGTLYAGTSGGRWLRKPAGELVSGLHQTSEGLVQIIRRADDDWLFVGERGSIFRSDSPLGEFHSVQVQAQPFERLVASPRSLLGVGRDGRLQMAAFAKQGEGLVGEWAAAQMKGLSEAEQVLDIAIGEGAEAYALTTPERLWKSEDHGASWASISAPRIGAQALSIRQSELFVSGLEGVRRLEGGGWGPLLSALPTSTELKLEGKLELGPSADALLRRQAVLRGERYWELSRARADAHWEILYGKIGEPLKSRRTPLPERCFDVILLASGERLVATCSAVGERGAAPVELQVSEDQGKSWRVVKTQLTGQPSNLKLALSAEGLLLISGACPEEKTGEACNLSGLYSFDLSRLSPSDGELSGREWAVPSLRGKLIDLKFSASGKIAYLVGVRDKSAKLGVFITSDGGRSFQVQELSGSEPGQVGSYSGEDGGQLRWLASQSGADGEFGVSFQHRHNIYLAVLDVYGQIISINKIEAGGEAVSIAGAHVLQVVEETSEVLESVDGGASFRSIGTLPSHCDAGKSCHQGIYCADSGCVIGESITRVGWGPQEPVKTFLTDQVRAKMSRFRVRAPLVCQLGEEPWSVIPGLVSTPGVMNAAQGKHPWVGVSENRASASADLIYGIAKTGARGHRVGSQALFPAAKNPAGTALAVRRSEAGIAAIRFDASSSSAGYINQLEAAWYNPGSDRLRRQRVAGPIAGAGRSFIEITGGNSQLALPSVLNIQDDQLLLAPFITLQAGQPVFLLDEKAARGFAVPAQPTQNPQIHSQDFAYLDGQVMRLRFAAGGGTVFAEPADGVGSPGAMGSSGLGGAQATLAPPAKTKATERYQFELFHHGNNPYLRYIYGDSEGLASRTVIIPLTASLDQPGQLGPNLMSLGEEPAPCSEEQLRDTPRVVSAFPSGTKHPVLVNSSSEPQLFLMSQSAAIYGTEKKPCMAALEASVVKTAIQEQTHNEHALILVDDLARSWLFRRRPNEASSGMVQTSDNLEYRSMSCRFEPEAELPVEVYNQPDTRSPRD